MIRRSISLILTFVLCLMLFPSAAFAAKELPSGTPDGQIEQRIEDYIEAHRDTTAAVAVAVFRGKDTLCQTVQGFADIENGLEANEETVFQWGSVTKLLVWVSVMQLWEQGRIDLEADVRTYLPDGFFARLKYDAPITMLHLMNHNAGWQEAVLQLCAQDPEHILPL